MKRALSICCTLAILLLATACERQSAEVDTQNGTAENTANPAAIAETEIKSGKVIESMNAAGYSYILVEKDGKQTWIAVLETAVNVGDEISYYDGMIMSNFVSKTLDRTFDEIVFSNGLIGQTAMTASLPAADGSVTDSAGSSFADAMAKQGGQAAAGAEPVAIGSSKAVVPFADIKVEKVKGENSYTIEEIFTKAAELNGKTITVRGKVMKISSKIMGRSWIHLQDGTGDPAKNTHDLVVTTTDPTSDSWETITVVGVLAADKNFGAGYIYDAILEDTKISE